MCYNSNQEAETVGSDVGLFIIFRVCNVPVDLTVYEGEWIYVTFTLRAGQGANVYHYMQSR